MFFCSTSAFAQSVVISGKADNARAVIVLVTKKGVPLNSMVGSDIVWIDQQEVDKEGNFEIKLPILSEDSYEIYTNAPIEKDDSGIRYASSNGTGNGKYPEHPSTLAEIYKELDVVNEIIIVDDVNYMTPSASYSGTIKISGLKGSEKLVLPSEVSLKGNLIISHLALSTQSKIYANGYELEICDNVTSDVLTVYGGKNGETCNKTSLKLYGGKYSAIYGGCSNANVKESTKIVFAGNAVTDYIYGAGSGWNAGAPVTNVEICGGTINESVYGGTSDVAFNGNTNIVMTAGKTEAIFGGCANSSMTGNTYVTVKGGEVTRRIHGGCYNDYGLSWSTDYYVNGTTNIVLYPEAKLITGSNMDKGIYAGSRREKDTEDETNTIIFLNESYSKFGSKIASGSFLNPAKSLHDYIVKSAIGGNILPYAAGQARVETQNGVTALSNGVRYENGALIPLTKETVVTFDGITSAHIQDAETDTKANADVVVSSTAELFAAIYDENGILISCGLTPVDSSKNYIVNIDCKLEKNKKYTAKLFLFKDKVTLVPIAGRYEIEVR